MKIVLYPAPTLSNPSTPLDKITDEVQKNIREMFRIMYELKGVGLAAPQVGWNVRLFVTNTRKDAQPGNEKIYINPEILELSEDKATLHEGCLSLPFVWTSIRRHLGVRIRAQNENGETFEDSLEGLDAQAIQHEVDHLNGMLIIERMSPADFRANSPAIRDLEKRWKEGNH
jgi:peptide deformylase